MRKPLAILATLVLVMVLACVAIPARATIISNGLFDKGTALSDTHVEVIGIELPQEAR